MDELLDAVYDLWLCRRCDHESEQHDVEGDDSCTVCDCEEFVSPGVETE